MGLYVAFLRGINVGGKNIIKMDVLKEMFISMGLNNVKTIIQSGNVIFETAIKDKKKLTLKIEAKLKSFLGNEVKIFLRTKEEILEIINLDPFKTTNQEEDIKLYVCFLYEATSEKLTMPMISSKKDVEVFLIKNNDAFTLSKKVDGKYGFPNNFIETELGIAATTRNWKTMIKLESLL